MVLSRMSFAPPLRLVAVEAWPLALPLVHPMRLASETIHTAETLLVRAVDAEGREGWGEASIAPTMTGELLPGMVSALRRFLAPALLAAPIASPAEAAHRLDRAIRGNTGAKAAAEIAVLDLLARRAGVPLAALLGEAQRGSVPAIRMVGEADPDATLAGVQAARAAGFSHVKLKLGMAATPEADAALIQRARAVLGPEAHLSGDVNMAWSRDAAHRFLAALPAGTLNYLEQPVADDDLVGMAALARLGCPLCLDEGLHAVADIDRYAARHAAAGVGLKAIKLGGLLATLAADRRARAHGLQTTLACKIAETSVGAAATLHLAAVVTDVSWGVSVTQPYLAEDITAAPLPVTCGIAAVPPGPGHGVVPEAARLARFTWKDS
jgi:muconate cycloisomerase